MNDFATVTLAIDSGVSKVFDHIENEGPMWSGIGKRWARSVIRFESAFAQPPAIQLSIAMIDADSSRNLRLELHSEDITTTGFTAVAHTWNDTRIGRLQVNWTAIGGRGGDPEARWSV